MSRRVGAADTEARHAHGQGGRARRDAKRDCQVTCFHMAHDSWPAHLALPQRESGSELSDCVRGLACDGGDELKVRVIVSRTRVRELYVRVRRISASASGVRSSKVE